MESNSGIPNNFSPQELLRMASSPAGRQLIAMLQQRGGDGFQAAVSSAAAGDYSQAKRIIEDLMSNPQAQQLLKELGG